MRRQFWIWLSIIALLASLPAIAGDTPDDQAKDQAKKYVAKEKAEKCAYSAQECLDKMAAKFKNSGWVGIEYEPHYDEDTGSEYWLVSSVVPESPAEAGGLLSGDTIYGMYGIEFGKANKEKLKEAHKDWAPGQEVVYMVKREGEKMDVTVTLATWPADVVAKWIGKHMMLDHAQVAEDVASANP